MDLELLEFENGNLMVINVLEKPIANVQDAVDILGNASYQGAVGVIMKEEQFDAEFFDLKTRLAGEILQKYVNYHMKLAIIGDFGKYESKALQSFIIECNRGTHIYFVNDIDSALVKLTN